MEYDYYSSVVPREVEWLWYPYIPYGKITLLQGDPGEGKSTFVINLIAILTKGGTLPGGKKIDTPHTVIYQCAEDSNEDTVKPRLLSAGADCEKVAFIIEKDRNITLNDVRIENVIKSTQAKLLVLDPIQAFIPPDSDMLNATKMRSVMRRLANVVEEHKCAVLLVGHLNKATGGKNLYRGLGSIDIAAIARSIQKTESMVFAFKAGGRRMSEIYRVGGYVKLAKLWERSRDKAIKYHKEYYKKKYADNDEMQLVDVYIDITGKQHIYQRPEMLRLLRDCSSGEINCIASQTHAYIAANMEELCYLIKFLGQLPYRIDIVTENEFYSFNTITNVDGQKEALQEMSDTYIKVKPEGFNLWKSKVDKAISKI